MRISFSTGTYYHLPLSYSLRLARDLGFDGVEWVVHPAYLLQGLDPARRAFADSGVRALSIHPPFYPLPGWPRYPARAAARLGALARHLGAELVVVHTAGFTSWTSPRADEFVVAVERGKLAGGPHVVVGVETAQYNKRPHRRFLLDELPTLVRFCQERDCGVTFDTCHAGANGQDVLDCYEVLKPVLRNVHLSDVEWRGSSPHTHRLPGEGQLPLDRLLQRMAADDYRGLVTLEVHPLKAGALRREQAVRRMSRALEYVQRYAHSPEQQAAAGAGERPYAAEE
jgi:sugar phosphate isomerase/epimerase